MREALAVIGRHRELQLVFVVLALVSMFAFSYSVSLPRIAATRWGGESNFGVVLSVAGVGSLTGSLLIARLARIHMRWYLGAIVLLGVSGLGVASAPALPIAMAWAIPLGVGSAAFIAAADGKVQQHAPAGMRGWMLALTSVAFLGLTPIGAPLVGLSSAAQGTSSDRRGRTLRWAFGADAGFCGRVGM